MIGFGEALRRLRFGRRFGFRLCFGRRRCWRSRFGRLALRRRCRLRLGCLRRFRLLRYLRRRHCFHRFLRFRRRTVFGIRRAFCIFFFCRCSGSSRISFGIDRGTAFGGAFSFRISGCFCDTAVRCRAAVGRCYIRAASRKAQQYQSCEEGCEHFPFHHYDHLYLHNTEKHAKVQRNRNISRKSYILCAGLSSSSGNSSSDSSKASR